MGSMLSIDDVGILKATTIYLTPTHACRQCNQLYMPHVSYPNKSLQTLNPYLSLEFVEVG